MSKRVFDPTWWLDAPNKLRKTVAHRRRQALEAARREQFRDGGVVNPAPVFVVGCSRSGTTIVKKTLALSPELNALPGELFGFWSDVIDPARRGWDSDAATADDASDAVRDRCREHYYAKMGSGRFIDKTCINGFKVPFLQAIWPDARFVYLRRDGRDNVSSMINGWRRHEQFQLYQLPVSTGLEGIPEGRWCFFLEPGWREVLNTNLATVCAHQWVGINQALLDAKTAVDPERWVELRYEDLFERPDAMFAEAFECLDLPYTDAIRRQCREIAGTRVSIAGSAPARAKWRRENPQAIESILPAIEGMMARLGYR